MATRSISIALEAKVQGFTSGLRTAQQAANDMGNRMAKFAKDNEQHMDRVGKASMLMGGSLLAGVGLAVKAASDFDSAMSEVQASTHETAANMDRLRQAAVDAGADTAFSAKEAAGAIDELSKAGVSTKDVLAGGLQGSLDLAAAGSLAVADAAEISATALTQFKLSGKDIPHVADLLAAGAGKAQGSVEDIGGALKQSGLVASQFGLSLEDTTGTLAAFASAGLIGSDSGTSLKTMLLKLAAPSKEAAGMMSDLGIAAYDSNGAFVGVTNLAGQLHDKLGGLTQAQRDSTLATIFGTDAIRGANVLYEQGAQGIAGWITKVNDAGYAAETARIKQDNLAGDLEKLGGSFDTVLIQSGSGANEVLRGLVQGMEGLVDAVGKVPGPVLGVATGFTAVIGGAGLLAGGLLTVIPKIAETKAAMAALAPAGSKANAALSRTGRIAAGAATGLAALAAASTLAQPALDKILAPTGETADALDKFAGQAAKGAIGADTLSLSFQDLVQHKEGVSDFQAAIEGIADPGIWGNLDNVLVDIGNVGSLGFAKLSSTSEEARNRFKAFGEQLASVDAGKASDAFKSMANQTDGSQEKLKQLLDLMPAYRKTLEDQAKSAQVATDDQTLLDIAMGKVPASMQAATGAVESYTNAQGQVTPISPEVQQALDDIGVSASGAATDLDKFTQALFNSGLATMSEREATAAHEAAIDGVKGAVEDATAALAKQYEAQGMGADAAKAQAEAQMKLGAALNQNKTDFDLTTDAGRILNEQFQNVAQTGIAEIEAKAKAGAGQPELQANLKTTYDSLITALGGMGIVGGGADTLARKVLGIPKQANIKTWMSDEAKRMAEQTAGAVDRLDGRTAHTYVYHHEINTIENITTSSSSVHNNTGGKQGTKPTFHATGGAIIGPGTGTSDDIMAMLSNGEHVLTAAEVAKMGGQAAVYRFRQMLDMGKLPKFAGGGAVARREAWIDYLRDARRGNGYRSVVGSLSNAYSFADRLTSLADSGNVSAASIRNLYTAAGKGEGALRTLHGRADRLSASLEKAKDKVAELSQKRDSIRGHLNGEFSIGDAMKNTSPFKVVTLQGIQGAANAVLARIRTFAGKLNKLRAMGYSGAVLEEIAGLGSVEGMVAADALLKGSKADVKNLNGVYGSIDAASKAAGTYVTDAMYKGGINAANGLVKGLQSQEKAIEQQMLKIGLGMEGALKRALGIRSPSRKAAAIGDNFAGTLADRLQAGASPVAKQAKALGDAMSINPQGYAYRPTPVTYRPAPISHTAAQQGPMQMTGTLVMDSGEILGVFNGVATTAIKAADAQSQYTRTGSR